MNRLLILLLTCLVAATSCDAPAADNGVLVRFTAPSFSIRKFAVGAAVDDFLLNTGYRPDGSITEFYDIPAGTRNIYDFVDAAGFWRLLETDYPFEAGKRYEAAGIGWNAYVIAALP
ncbi:MAG: hypothetical protein JXD23_04380 [Spirochaetales bacterium]|nr:hypothetical protein [Spirochaetales bacterium]